MEHTSDYDDYKQGGTVECMFV